MKKFFVLVVVLGFCLMSCGDGASGGGNGTTPEYVTFSLTIINESEWGIPEMVSYNNPSWLSGEVISIDSGKDWTKSSGEILVGSDDYDKTLGIRFDNFYWGPNTVPEELFVFENNVLNSTVTFYGKTEFIEEEQIVTIPFIIKMNGVTVFESDYFE